MHAIAHVLSTKVDETMVMEKCGTNGPYERLRWWPYLSRLTTIETWFFRTFASVNRREPVRIWCEYANTRRLRPLRQSHTTSDEISACEYGANV